MPCCCWSDTKCDGEPVILLVLELEDIPGKGIAAGRWAGCGLKSALSKAEGKSRSRCIWIPSPGPIWLMWLKFDGAEIIFDRRSLLLFAREMNSQVRQLIACNEETYAGFEARLFSRTENRRLVLGWLLPARPCPTKLGSLCGTLTASQTVDKRQSVNTTITNDSSSVYLCLCCANKRCKVAQQRN